MGVSTTRSNEPTVTDPVLIDFATEVGPDGPVAVVGGGTAGPVGGAIDPAARIVHAPVGIVAIQPDELTVTVRAGTTVAALQDALGEVGQFVVLPSLGPASTVGGALALGWSDISALGYGPVRDSVLRIRYVDAWGRIVSTGGPTVKNVSGFDLCRLLVGSLGTIGLMGEVILRTRPRPGVTRWFTGSADARETWRRISPLRPTTLLWNGDTVWARLDGHHEDVAAAATVLAELGVDREVAGPPERPPHRRSLAPSALWSVPSIWPGEWLAELGTGIVHAASPPATTPLSPEVLALNRTIKAHFDPTGRLAPGRRPW